MKLSTIHRREHRIRVRIEKMQKNILRDKKRIKEKKN